MQEQYGGPISTSTSSLYYVSLAQAIAESPLEEGELWFGSDDSTVQVSRNGGESWDNVSPEGLPEWTTFSGIEVSPHDRGTAYLAANRYRVSDRTTYFYKTTDYGRSWQKIHGRDSRERFRAGDSRGSRPAGIALCGHGNGRLRVIRWGRVLAVASAQPAGGAGTLHARQGQRPGPRNARARLVDHGQPDGAAPANTPR